ARIEDLKLKLGGAEQDRDKKQAALQVAMSQGYKAKEQAKLAKDAFDSASRKVQELTDSIRVADLRTSELETDVSNNLDQIATQTKALSEQQQRVASLDEDLVRTQNDAAVERTRLETRAAFLAKTLAGLIIAFIVFLLAILR